MKQNDNVVNSKKETKKVSAENDGKKKEKVSDSVINDEQQIEASDSNEILVTDENDVEYADNNDSENSNDVSHEGEENDKDMDEKEVKASDSQDTKMTDDPENEKINEDNNSDRIMIMSLSSQNNISPLVPPRHLPSSLLK